MSDMGQNDVTAPPAPPKPKRKWTRRKPVEKIAKPDPYAGMTETSCADACLPHRCVITLKGQCGHPRKGALQDLGSLHRWQAAKMRLAHIALDKTKV